MSGSELDPQSRAQARQATIVILATMLLWFVVQLIGAEYGWPVRLAFFFDLAAGAAFLWALIVLFRIWRRRNRN